MEHEHTSRWMMSENGWDEPSALIAQRAADVAEAAGLDSHVTAGYDAWRAPWIAVEFAARYDTCCPSQHVPIGWDCVESGATTGAGRVSGTFSAQCPGCGLSGVGTVQTGARFLRLDGDVGAQLADLVADAHRRCDEARR